MYMPKSRVSQARNYAESVISVHREAWYCERSEQYHSGNTWEQIGRNKAQKGCEVGRYGAVHVTDMREEM